MMFIGKLMKSALYWVYCAGNCDLRCTLMGCNAAIMSIQFDAEVDYYFYMSFVKAEIASL